MIRIAYNFLEKKIKKFKIAIKRIMRERERERERERAKLDVYVNNVFVSI